jgi:hypothetical protein
MLLRVSLNCFIASLRTLAWAAAAAAALAASGAFAEPLHTQEPPASNDPASGPRLEIHGYGDLGWSHYDFGPDPRATPTGSAQASRSTMDVRRLAVEMEGELLEHVEFEAEVEFEHGGTGTSLELDYDEFGEYEQDIEKGGEVVVEELHLTRTFGDALNLRLGHFYVAVGLTFDHYRPLDHLGTRRNEAESSVIPVLWHETGVAAFGRLGRVRWWAQLVNGLDSTGFGSKTWIAGGQQKRFEEIRASDLAIVGRVDVQLGDSSTLGVSGYTGDSGGNRPKDDLGGAGARVTVGDLHGEIGWRGAQIRGVFLYGHLADAERVTNRNRTLSNHLGASRTPVASGAYALSLEAGYDVLPLLARGSADAVVPFVRYDRADSMHETEGAVFDNPRFARRILTLGLDWRLRQRVVLECDYAMRRLGENGVEFNHENTAALGVGFQF